MFSKNTEIAESALPIPGKYSINLMYIQRADNHSLPMITNNVEARFGMDPIVNQLNKWSNANPEAEINFWFDSQRNHTMAIENTIQFFKANVPNVKLRDIREIPFVQDNPDWFLANTPVYFRVDLLKLIIPLYLMEQGVESVVYADMSICGAVEKALGPENLFKPEVMVKLQKHGLLIGIDAQNKPENQFVQTLHSEELLYALRHSINCCMLMISNWLNHGLKHNPNFVALQWGHLTDIIYKTAIREFVPTMLQAIRSGEPILVRADVVNEGTDQEWVNYQPALHGYIVFGNHLDRELIHGEFVKYADNIDSTPELNFFDGDCIRFGETTNETNEYFSRMSTTRKTIVRSDVNPSRAGNSHYQSSDTPSFPSGSDHFSLKYWPDPVISLTPEHIQAQQSIKERNQERKEGDVQTPSRGFGSSTI
jgi:hypothetical protein